MMETLLIITVVIFIASSTTLVILSVYHNKTSQWVSAMLPKRVVYFTAIRLGVYATTGKYGRTEVPKITFMDALKRWEDMVKDL